PSEDGQGRKRAGSDDDLLGRGRQPALGVAGGDPGAQRRQARGQVAVPAQVGRQRRQGALVGRGQAGRGGGGGAVEVDGALDRIAIQQRTQGVVMGAATIDGNGGIGARALPGLGESGLGQVGVGAGDGDPGKPQGGGDRTLAGQPGADRDAAVADQLLQGQVK